MKLKLIVFAVLLAIAYWKYEPEPIPLPEPIPITGGGNTSIRNFHEAKKLARQIYADMQTTFYCGCHYPDREVDFSSCDYRPARDDARARRVEWEHVVPAAQFGRSFREWRDGDPRCQNSSGRPFKGRKCAQVVSETFNKMESDLYNLVPAIGEVNGLRRDYPVGLLPGVKPMFGLCQTKVAHGLIEPRPEVRGFVARTYKYMHSTYPGHGIISRKNEPLFQAWDKQFPPSRDEQVRAQRIARVQGNVNSFVSGGTSNKPL